MTPTQRGQFDGPPSDPSRARLTARTVAGVQWVSLMSVSNVGVQLLYTVLMARLLTPAAFGLMAVATLWRGFGVHFAHMGVSQAIIQRRDVTDEHLRASWTSSVGLGVAFFGITWFGAPLIAELFRLPEAVPVLRVMGLTFILQGMHVTAQSVLARDLRFRDHAMASMGSVIPAYLVVGLGLGLLGAGVWSLVGAALALDTLLFFLLFRKGRHPVRPVFRWPVYATLYSYGAKISVINAADFLAHNLDTVVVGRYNTASALGQYNRAFYILQYPLELATSSFSRVLFPGLSKIQEEPERLREVFFSSLRFVLVVIAPVCAGVAVASHDVVFTILGDQWDPAADILPILAVAVAFNLATYLLGTLFEATAVLNVRMGLQLLHIVVLAGLLSLAIGRDLWAYAAALALAELIRHIANLVAARQVVGPMAGHLLRIYGSAALGSAGVAGAVAATQAGLLAIDAPLLVRFSAAAAAGAFALFLLVRIGPLSAVRHDLMNRLARADMLDRLQGWRGRLVLLALGRGESE